MAGLTLEALTALVHDMLTTQALDDLRRRDPDLYYGYVPPETVTHIHLVRLAKDTGLPVFSETTEVVRPGHWLGEQELQDAVYQATLARAIAQRTQTPEDIAFAETKEAEASAARIDQETLLERYRHQLIERRVARMYKQRCARLPVLLRELRHPSVPNTIRAYVQRQIERYDLRKDTLPDPVRVFLCLILEDAKASEDFTAIAPGGQQFPDVFFGEEEPQEAPAWADQKVKRRAAKRRATALAQQKFIEDLEQQERFESALGHVLERERGGYDGLPTLNALYPTEPENQCPHCQQPITQRRVHNVRKGYAMALTCRRDCSWELVTPYFRDRKQLAAYRSKQTPSKA